MSEKVIVQCTACGARAKVSAEHLGRRARCKSCGEAFELRAEPVEPLDPPALNFADFPPVPPAHASIRPAPPITYPPPVPARKAGGFLDRYKDTLLYKIGAVVVIVASLAVIIALQFRSFNRRTERSLATGRAIDEAFIKPKSSDQAVILPVPPPAPAKPLAAVPVMQFSPVGDRSVGEVLVQGRKSNATRVRLVLPAGKLADASLP